MALKKHVRQAGYEPTYWNGKGKYQKEYEELRAKLVPPAGKAETALGEALRCIGKFYNERYANGHRNSLITEARYATVYLRTLEWSGSSVNVDMPDSELDRAIDFILERVLRSGDE
jgi:hypothetical protein